MDTDPTPAPPSPAKEISYPKQKVQNENIEPKVENKPTQNTAKSFYNNKEASQPKAVNKIVSSNSCSTDSQPGTFNGFKIYGISSLNPYQNKYEQNYIYFT